jgi:alkylation response protein AidB-like acyl-CoA dehydrogenase
MTKVAVSEALMRVADRCVQCMGGQGVTADTIVEQIFREVRAFRIYDGPTEVHKWSLAKTIKREWQRQQNSRRRCNDCRGKMANLHESAR